MIVFQSDQSVPLFLFNHHVDGSASFDPADRVPPGKMSATRRLPNLIVLVYLATYSKTIELNLNF